MTETAPKIYEKMCAIMAEIAKDGIGKEHKNQQQNYAFRGIDDVYNVLAPILSRHRVICLPEVLSRDQVERITPAKIYNGQEQSPAKAIFFTTVQVKYTFICADDGSSHVITTFGEASDYADKSTNKALSAAYKYAMIQAFCIPTEGDANNPNDPDAKTLPPVQPLPGAPDEYQLLVDQIKAGAAIVMNKLPETMRPYAKSKN